MLILLLHTARHALQIITNMPVPLGNRFLRMQGQSGGFSRLDDDMSP